MDTLASFVDGRAPLQTGSDCAVAQARFAAESDAVVLAVCDGERPIGLISREVAMAQRDGARPIAEIMDAQPAIAQAGMTPWGFREHLLATRPAALNRGFIIVEDDRYVGVGTPLTLLTARRPRSRTLQDPGAILIQRMSGEVLRHLAGVADFTNRLRQQNLPPDAQACVRAILETGEELTSMMRRAVDLHEADLGVLSFDTRPCQLRELMDAVDARWKTRAANSGLTLLTAYDGDSEAVADIDEHRLMQVFDALIYRALSETRRGAVEASLKVRPTDNGLILEGRVRDAGGDVSPQRLARIFEPVGSVDDHGEGLSTGLGMALASRIASAAGGVIRAEPNPGAGVTVVFEFIARQAKSVAAAAPAPSEAPAHAAHILIVDDNATNRMVAEALCEMFDCTSEQAVDGLEALDAVQARRFDLILMDIKMPRMDGVAATRAIRALPGPVGRTPIIALTANADPDDVRGYIEAGMNDVVEKPIKADRMLAALQAALDAADDQSAAA
ncbi:response regulator [Phenylobacterium sp.]|uniref:response regulator n=1 Tax=Phenylobacterium sp. TaxID=1871053 RepID=UPI002730726D|nr:response regulator [Phenylobacterium sp.]MDP1874537.1 response regulator [Phenylobacterium sp.]